MDASSSIATGIAIDANGSPVGGVYPIVPVMRAGRRGRSSRRRSGPISSSPETVSPSRGPLCSACGILAAPPPSSRSRGLFSVTGAPRGPTHHGSRRHAARPRLSPLLGWTPPSRTAVRTLTRSLSRPRARRVRRECSRYAWFRPRTGTGESVRGGHLWVRAQNGRWRLGARPARRPAGPHQDRARAPNLRHVWDRTGYSPKRTQGP